MILAKKYQLQLVLIGILCANVLNTQFAKHTYADSKEFNFVTNCTQGAMGSFTSITSIASPQDVYIKLGIPNQTVQADVYAIDEENSLPCQKIGTAQLDGKRWTNVGKINPYSDARTVIEVFSPNLGYAVAASRPMALLIDPNNPVCIPNVECELPGTNGQQYIRPPSTENDKSSLSVRIPHKIENDTVLDVSYYASSRRVYTSKKLQEFDMRFASHSDELLQRVVKYKSGQEVVYEQRTPQGFQDSFGNYLTRIFVLKPWVAQTLSIISGVLLIWLLLRFFIAKLYDKYAYNLHHGLVSSSSWHAKLLSWIDVFEARIRRPVRLIIRLAMLGTLVYAGIFMTQNVLASIYEVNGESMEGTFHNHQSMLVNKLPVAYAQLSGNKLAPNRGDVVIVDAIYGLIDVESVPQEKHTIVKRVLGLPGERVTLNSGKIRVYNQLQPNGFDVDAGSSWEKTMNADDSTFSIDVTLGHDEVFVAGDNRPVSFDSRHNGPVKLDQIVGTVAYHW